MSAKNFTRLAHLLIAAGLLYGVSMIGLPHEVRTVLVKYGHAAGGAYFGYWIDRWLFQDRILVESSDITKIRRAVIVAATMWVVSGGL